MERGDEDLVIFFVKSKVFNFNKANKLKKNFSFHKKSRIDCYNKLTLLAFFVRSILQSID